MTIRTTSQLPQATYVQQEDLLDLSQCSAGKYSSHRLSVSVLENSFT